MNFKNKYFVISLRTLFGLLFVASGISGLYIGLSGMQGVPAESLAMTQMLWDSGIFQMIKVTEIVAGLMFLFGMLPALAAIFAAPICIGIVVFSAFASPVSLPIGVVMSLVNAYFGYVYWEKYRAIFKR